MKKRLVSVLLCVAMAASMIGCGSSNSESKEKETEKETTAQSEDEAPETTTIRLAQTPSGQIINAVAEAQGFLADEGITVEYVQCESSADAFTAMSAGKVDVISTAGTYNPLQYIAKGTDITIFGGYMITGCMPIIARKGTKWNGVEDLIGKTVAETPTLYQVTGPLLDMGYDPVNDVKWLNLTNAKDRVEAVRSGEADYAILPTGQMYTVENMDDIEIVSYSSDVLPNYSCCRAEANTEWVEKNPNTVKALLRAWIRAQEYYEDHKEEAISMLAETLGTPDEYVAAYVNNEHLRLSIDPYKKSVEKAWGYIEQLGYFDANATSVNIDDYVNTELYKEALDKCIELYHDDDPDFYDNQLKVFEENDQ